MATAVWRGLDAHRLEIAHVEQAQGELRAAGTQIGVAYELRYELEPGLLRVEVVGESRRELALDGADFFDSRPSSTLSLEVSESAQRYEPLDARTIRFRAVDFTTLVQFRPDSLVERYEGLAERLR